MLTNRACFCFACRMCGGCTGDDCPSEFVSAAFDPGTLSIYEIGILPPKEQANVATSKVDVVATKATGEATVAMQPPGPTTSAIGSFILCDFTCCVDVCGLPTKPEEPWCLVSCAIQLVSQLSSGH